MQPILLGQRLALDPCRTLPGHHPCGPQPGDSLKRVRPFSSGSGLTTNRKNRFHASGLYLAFKQFLVPLDQRFTIDPRFALPAWVSRTCRVTRLEPRIHHQPVKRAELSKNDCSCTPVENFVNQKSQPPSPLFSITCAPSTDPCRENGAARRDGPPRSQPNMRLGPP